MSILKKLKSILRKSKIRQLFGLRKISGLQVSGISYMNRQKLSDEHYPDIDMVIVDIDLGQKGDKKLLINGQELHTDIRTGKIRLKVLPETTWQIVQSVSMENAWVNPSAFRISRKIKNKPEWEPLKENVTYVYSVNEKDTSEVLPLPVYVNLGYDGDKKFLINNMDVSGTKTGCQIFYIPPNAAYGLFGGLEKISIVTFVSTSVKNHPANLY